MKKLTTTAANWMEQQGLTIGLDLGDRSSHYCVLDESGRIVVEGKTRNEPQGDGGNVRRDDPEPQTLARLARIDPELLCPVKHRSAKAQADLSLIRARAGLVRARTALVNTAHLGTVRSGLRLATMGTEVGRTRRKEWEETGHHRHRTKACGAAASPLDQRRNLRTPAQQPDRDCGGCVGKN